jgi:hypothetical protein
MDQLTPKAEASSKVNDLLELATRHFALLSAGVILLGGFTATLFLAAYLRVFDWRLIWMIEPSDILKVGILSLAFLSGFVWLIQMAVNWASSWTSITDPLARRVLIAGGCVSFAAVILQDERSTDPHLFLHSLMFILLGMLFALVVFWPKVKGGITLSFSTGYVALTVFSGVTILVGTLVGTYVKEIGGFTENVWTKNEQFQSVVVIIATSHHTALLTRDDGVIVIPSTDIQKMQATGAH